MRKLKELYQLLYDKVKNCKTTYGYFICNNIKDLYRENLISEIEKTILFEHFIANKPTSILYPNIYNLDSFYKNNSMAWFSEPYIEDSQGNDESLQNWIKWRLDLLTEIMKILD